MLSIELSDSEFYDPVKEEFVSIKGQTLQLEHSLVSISKWEAKWKKAFLGNEQKTEEEMLDYIKCMTITKNVDPSLFLTLTQDQVQKISDYIQDPMTATWFSEDKTNAGGGRETVTSELIYYWMIALQIPVEFQRWHLNRLLTLIRVCNVKNTPPKKMSKRDIMNRNRSLNEARRKALHTSG